MDGPKGNLSVIPGRLEPQPRGESSRWRGSYAFATALRVTAPLGCGYPGFWVLLSSRFPRSAAVCCKSFVFSFLPIRKVLVLPFREGR